MRISRSSLAAVLPSANGMVSYLPSSQASNLPSPIRAATLTPASVVAAAPAPAAVPTIAPAAAAPTAAQLAQVSAAAAPTAAQLAQVSAAAAPVTQQQLGPMPYPTTPIAPVGVEPGLPSPSQVAAMVSSGQIIFDSSTGAWVDTSTGQDISAAEASELYTPNVEAIGVNNLPSYTPAIPVTQTAPSVYTAAPVPAPTIITTPTSPTTTPVVTPAPTIPSTAPTVSAPSTNTAATSGTGADSSSATFDWTTWLTQDSIDGIPNWALLAGGVLVVWLIAQSSSGKRR